MRHDRLGNKGAPRPCCCQIGVPDECERSDPASMVHPSKRKRRRLPGKCVAAASSERVIGGSAAEVERFVQARTTPGA